MGGKTWCLASAALVAAQPLAAAELVDGNRIEQRSGAFAGATLTLGLDGSRERPAPARLGFGVSRIQLRSASAARVDRIQTPGLELALAGGKPQLMIAGQSAKAAQTRLGMSSTTTTLLIVGGIAVAVLGIMELTGDDDDDDSCPIAPPC
jgi:hypothetical protein